MRYSVIVEEDILDGGYIAYVPAIRGCFTQADTLDELKTNIIEAIELSLEEEKPSHQLFGIWELEVEAHATTTHY